MFFFSSGRQASRSFFSSADSSPIGWIFSTPLGCTRRCQKPGVLERKERTYAELDVRGEEVDALVGEQRALNKGRGHNTLLAIQPAEDGVGELGTSVGHGEGGAPSALLGLDDLITTELDTVDELLVDLTGDRLALIGLREEGHNGGAAVAADDSDGGL